MPGRDRTGPMGAGPRTGRGMGYCGSYDSSGFANPFPDPRSRFGIGGWGMGRGRRNRFYATGVPGWVTPTPEQETADLNAQAAWLRKQLDDIQKRLDELTSK